MADSSMHGRSIRLVSTKYSVYLEIERSASSSGNVNCHIFVISDSHQLQSVQYRPTYGPRQDTLQRFHCGADYLGQNTVSCEPAARLLQGEVWLHSANVPDLRQQQDLRRLCRYSSSNFCDHPATSQNRILAEAGQSIFEGTNTLIIFDEVMAVVGRLKAATDPPPPAAEPPKREPKRSRTLGM